MNIKKLQSMVSGVQGVEVVEGKGGLPVISVKNTSASAEISLYGGQILKYQAEGQNELLFLSERAYYEEGKAIKGGIPVCWPAFGASFIGEGRPFHGFARNRLWQLKSVVHETDNMTEVILQLEEDKASLVVFPHSFMLTLKLQISDSITVELITENTDKEAFDITQALHTYISVEDIANSSVSGLDKISYLDKAKSNTGEEHKCQQGDIKIESEVDRIYLDVPQQVSVEDRKGMREVIIRSEGNQALVIWNPWKELCEQSADLDDSDYLRFICIETANAADDIISLQPGETAMIKANYSVRKLQ